MFKFKSLNYSSNQKKPKLSWITQVSKVILDNSGEMKGHKTVCEKCGRPGWERIKTVKDHKYRYFVHIQECYLGPVEKKRTNKQKN